MLQENYKAIDILVAIMLIIQIILHTILNGISKDNNKSPEKIKTKLNHPLPEIIMGLVNTALFIHAIISGLINIFLNEKEYKISDLLIKTTGAFLISSGILLRYWCVRTLGKFFTYTVKILQNHRIVKEGPYEYLVHPSYTGAMLIWYGILFYLRISARHLLVMALLGFFSGYYRVSSEELALKNQFKEEWDKHLNEKKRFIPGIF